MDIRVEMIWLYIAHIRLAGIVSLGTLTSPTVRPYTLAVMYFVIHLRQLHWDGVLLILL